MTTSGITENQLTRNQIIEAAHRKLGVVADGQTLSTENYNNAVVAFNALLGEFRTLGMPLWARTSYILTLVNGTSSYTFGTGQTVNTPYPLKILQAWRIDSSSSSVIQMDIIADYNFNLLPVSSSGTPIQLTYQPLVNSGVIKVWPTPDANAAAYSTVKIVYQRPMEYVSASSDTMDIPEEWLKALIFQLAVDIAPEWSIPLPDRQKLEQQAEKALNRVLDFGAEDGSLFFQIDRR